MAKKVGRLNIGDYLKLLLWCSVRRKVILIEKTQKEDLKEILVLQYLTYQSEAKLFGDIIGSVSAYEEKGTV